jgi:hypothetical protein
MPRNRTRGLAVAGRNAATPALRLPTVTVSVVESPEWADAVIDQPSPRRLPGVYRPGRAPDGQLLDVVL